MDSSVYGRMKDDILVGVKVLSLFLELSVKKYRTKISSIHDIINAKNGGPYRSEVLIAVLKSSD